MIAVRASLGVKFDSQVKRLFSYFPKILVKSLKASIGCFIFFVGSFELPKNPSIKLKPFPNIEKKYPFILATVFASL